MAIESDETKAPEEFPCPHCGSTKIDSIVEGGSYCGRCSKCRENLFVTSWIAVAPQWNSRVRVYSDGHEAEGPLLEGLVSEISERIQQFAANGALILIPVLD